MGCVFSFCQIVRTEIRRVCGQLVGSGMNWNKMINELFGLLIMEWL